MGKQNILTRNKKKQAIKHLQDQQFQEARKILEDISRRDRTDSELPYLLGSCYGQLGLLEEAVENLRKAIRLNPNLFVAYDNLGTALFMQGKKAEAMEMFRKSVDIEPNYFIGHYNLGNAFKEIGDMDSAISAYKTAIAIKPDYFDAHNNIGVMYYLQDDTTRAIDHIKQSLSLNPEQPGGYRTLYKAYFKSGNINEAVKACTKLIQMEPDNAENYLKLALMRNEQGFDQETENNCKKAIELREDYIEAYDLMAVSHMSRGNLDKAKIIYEHMSTLTQDLNNEVRTLTGQAGIDIKLGNYEQAYTKLVSLYKSDKLTPHGAFLLGSISKHTGKQEEAIRAIKHIIDNNKANFVDDLKHMHFGLADVYDQIGQFDKAFEQYTIANALSPYKYDADSLTSTTDHLISTVNTNLLNTSHHANNNECPVFIVGMNRSGTSLTEQIISSHPDVYGAGELEFVVNLGKSLSATKNNPDGQDYALDIISESLIDRAASDYLKYTKEISGNAAIVTDKMPHNFWHLPLIELLFPNAIIIHCMRNPLDTCLSNYFQDFGGKHQHTNNIEHICNYYIQYYKIMQHWKSITNLDILEISYESLVADQENISRKLIAHIGVEWDEACLDFHKSKRLVTTASSDQVKQQLYKRSVARWKNYENHLQSVMRKLDDAGISYTS